MRLMRRLRDWLESDGVLLVCWVPLALILALAVIEACHRRADPETDRVAITFDAACSDACQCRESRAR